MWNVNVMNMIKCGINFIALNNIFFTDVLGNSKIKTFATNDSVLENAGKIIKFVGVGFWPKKD